MPLPVSVTLPLSQSILQLEKFEAVPVKVTQSPVQYVALSRVKVLIVSNGRSAVYVPKAVTQEDVPTILALIVYTGSDSFGIGAKAALNVRVTVADVP
jgi:hypothetical protein